jgi:hypothetical protein
MLTQPASTEAGETPQAAIAPDASSTTHTENSTASPDTLHSTQDHPISTQPEASPLLHHAKVLEALSEVPPQENTAISEQPNPGTANEISGTAVEAHYSATASVLTPMPDAHAASSPDQSVPVQENSLHNATVHPPAGPLSSLSLRGEDNGEEGPT